MTRDLEAGPGAESGKQLSGQVGGIERVVEILPADIIIENSSLCSLVQVGQG